MAKKEQKMVIDRYNLYKYTTKDRDLIFAYCKKNRYGFPLYWPTKDFDGRQIVLSFVDAIICDKKGQQIDEEVANFDIYEEDCFDKKDPLAATKIKYIDALLTPGIYVRGGVYYRGEYFALKMTKNKANFFMKSFFDSYFHLEDGKLIAKYFFDNQEGRINYWPMKKKDGSRIVFSAVNATITDAKTKEVSGPYNFNIFFGEIFDFSSPESMEKLKVVSALINSEMTVDGFYYKGELLPKVLSKEFKSYLEKSFVKRNLSVDDKDFLLKNVSKDKKTGYPLFWPSQDEKARKICISVLNASGSIVEDGLESFDVYNDEPFDLTKEIFQKKLNIIRALFHQDPRVKGALYFDSVLIPGICSKDETYYRRDKVERILRIYITDNSDFQRISKHYTVEDRERLLNIAPIYDKYYPGNVIPVENSDREYKENKYLLKFDNVNVADENGFYKFENNLSGVIMPEDKTLPISNDELFMILKGLLNESYHVRGGLYYQGKNVSYKKPSPKLLEIFKGFLGEEKMSKAYEFGGVRFKKFAYEKKSKMPYVWPVKDKNGKNILLSVVDADVFFKVGRNIVKAVVNSNFDIYEGETFGLVGESGSGKTTISRAILKINKLTKGGIYFKGRLISKKLKKRRLLNVRKNIQMIFQDPAASLNERANIDYIVSEGLYNFKLFKSKEERQTKVVNMLGNVGLLPEHLSRYPHEFSGGQRQRIGIARALIVEPQLILADEPISALDVSIRAQVLNLLKKLQNEQNLTYLFIAHDLSIIRYISDRIAVMHQGYIVELGAAEEIYNRPLHPYTQSLLTAIPQPDPKTKELRVRVPFNKGDLDYSTCEFKDYGNGHFVLVDKALDEKLSKKGK